VKHKPLVELTGVGKNYPLANHSSDRLSALWDLVLGRPIRRTRNILHDIDLSVLPGCSFGIIGENGAGKSTLLKLITGVLRASNGSVKTRGRIGALLELGAGFHPDYTGRENIGLNAALVGLTQTEILAKTPEIIEFADIGEYIDEPIKHYSSGMVVRLGFAIIAATTPDRRWRYAIDCFSQHVSRTKAFPASHLDQKRHDRKKWRCI